VTQVEAGQGAFPHAEDARAALVQAHAAPAPSVHAEQYGGLSAQWLIEHPTVPQLQHWQAVVMPPPDEMVVIANSILSIETRAFVELIQADASMLTAVIRESVVGAVAETSTDAEVTRAFVPLDAAATSAETAVTRAFVRVCVAAISPLMVVTRSATYSTSFTPSLSVERSPTVQASPVSGLMSNDWR
jgi:hypothetical protein